MATETNKLSKTARVIIGLLVVLVAILFWLVLRQPTQQSNSLLGDNVSIRQDQDKIQWKLPGSDWQTITTVSELTAGAQGQPGKDGVDGKAGADGKDGQDGTDGVDGIDGVSGTNGKDGATGQNGADGQDGIDGAQGIQGIQGEQGIAGIDGQDGAQGVQGEQGLQGEQGIAGVGGTAGTDGREIELQKDLYYIQWRYVGEPGWRNLIAYSDLKGDKGDKGDTGANGPANTLSIGTVDRTACNPTATVTGTAPNQTLNLGIPGLPSGGTIGQVLTKNSSTDCDAIWANANVIVGAGRPDIAGTMDAGTQAKVASATSGTEFRSTDGPQGAWVWMKQGSKWVVTQGDTGLVPVVVWDATGIVFQAADVTLTNLVPQPSVGGGMYLRRQATESALYIERAEVTGINPRISGLPVGFVDLGARKFQMAPFTYSGSTGWATVVPSNTDRRISLPGPVEGSRIPSSAANAYMPLRWDYFGDEWPATLSL